MNDDEIQRLPEINKRLGSCPDCGTPIFESYKIGVLKPVMDDLVTSMFVYRCIGCKSTVSEVEMVPF